MTFSYYIIWLFSFKIRNNTSPFWDFTVVSFLVLVTSKLTIEMRLNDSRIMCTLVCVRNTAKVLTIFDIYNPESSPSYVFITLDLYMGASTYIMKRICSDVRLVCNQFFYSCNIKSDNQQTSYIKFYFVFNIDFNILRLCIQGP